MPKKAIFIIVLLLILVIVAGIFAFSKKDTMPDQATSDTPVSQEKKNVDYFPDDKDDDGITDAKEKELGTKDTEADSDGDGLSDVVEIEDTKTDPIKADTDGDGYSDAFEIMNGYNPLGEGKSDL